MTVYPTLKSPTQLTSLLIWVYRDQMAHRHSHMALTLPIHRDDDDGDDKFGRRQTAADGCVRLARIKSLGARIGTTAGFQRPVLDTDAEIVHEAVAVMSKTDPFGAHLLARHGLIAEIPDYCDEIPKPEPVMRLTRSGRDEIVEDSILPGNGYVRRVQGEDGPAWVDTGYPFCPLRYWPSFAAIEAARLDYRRWHRALSRLHRGLPPLRRWQIDGLGAEAEPWVWKEAADQARPEARRA